NPPWWSCANAVETILDYAARSSGTSRLPALAAMWEQHHANGDQAPVVIAELKRRKQWTEADEAKRQARAKVRLTTKAGYDEFKNEYLDDSGWWALAWLKMYDCTRGTKYLQTAKAIHAHMAKHWRAEGGGVLWHLEDKQPVANAITNSLFLILSARLYERTKEPAFLKWAQRAHDWVHQNALYDGTAVVDAPGHKGDHWTYNQGAWIGGLTALYLATGTQAYLDEAAQVADSILHRAGLFQEGVLVEKLGTSGWDPGLFKGVLMRYLGVLRDVLRDRKFQPALAEEIDKNLRSSVKSMILNATDKNGQYGVQWRKEPKGQEFNYNTQTAGLAALASLLRFSSP
ncbi:MAG TPA: glycoside hydrolase family 76 protein, partial [Verrucomicrobiales bacterium]|nr:glycoside hydrolase family 76 protein [Verrucomicrobiales bacterium]